MKKEIKIISDIIIKHLTGVCDFKITKYRESGDISLLVETSISMRFNDDVQHQIGIVKIIGDCIAKEEIPHHFSVSYRNYGFKIENIRKKNKVKLIYNCEG